MRLEIVLRVPYEVFLVAISISKCRCKEVVRVCVLMSSEGRCVGGDLKGNDGEVFYVGRNVGVFD